MIAYSCENKNRDDNQCDSCFLTHIAANGRAHVTQLKNGPDTFNSVH